MKVSPITSSLRQQRIQITCVGLLYPGVTQMKNRRVLRHSTIAPAVGTRSAFTLFELIIVLAIILVVTAMAAPPMMEQVRSGRVQDAAEKIREVLASARVYAIDTGVDYHVRYEVEGHHVVAIPAESNQLIGNSNDSDSETSDFFYRSAEIPETIFLRAARGDTSGSETLKSTAFGNLPNAGELASKSWSNPILFRFDGSAEDTTFRVIDEDLRSCDVTVRGLTGAISISGVFIMQDVK